MIPKKPAAEPVIIPARKSKKQKPLKLSDATRLISTRIGILGILLTFLASFSLPGAITTAISGDFSLTESGTAAIIQNVKLTVPLTIGLTIIFFAIIKDWFENVIVLYLFGIAVLVSTAVIFSHDGRELVSYSWQQSTGNVLFSFPENIIKNYFRLYFWAPFAGSLLTAIFLTWALLKLEEVKKWGE